MFTGRNLIDNKNTFFTALLYCVPWKKNVYSYNLDSYFIEEKNVNKKIGTAF
jgi:hypothetical protein